MTNDFSMFYFQYELPPDFESSSNVRMLINSQECWNIDEECMNLPLEEREKD